MTGSFDWGIILDIGVGLGVLVAGIGILVACSAMAKTLTRLNVTLDEVDRQIATLSAPIGKTLDHVGGIADTADTTVARLGTVVGRLELAAGMVAKTTTLASDAVAPALVNVGATLTGVTAGLRRLVTGRLDGTGAPPASGNEP